VRKRISPTAIGAFVVASFAILLIAVAVVGSGRIFARPVRFICMFPGSLNGLKVGAPVKVRGVQIGSVAAIKLRLLPSEGQIRPGVKEFRLPVIIELDRSTLLAKGATGEALGTTGYEQLIRQGMRAQLNVESLLTGLLYVDLDVHPGSQPDFVLEPGGEYREIPTVPTDLAQIQQRLTKALDAFEKIDFDGLVRSIIEASNSIKSLTGSPDSKQLWSRSKGRWLI
jgi:paraquat-inducible protein B